VQLGAIAIFWLFDAPPFMDFANHAGVIALRQRFDESILLQHYYVLTPYLTGYPLFRLLADTLAGYIDPVPVMRVISTIPVVALPWALHDARKRLYGDDSPLFAYVALVLSFGYLTQMGMTPFTIAFPVMVWALTKWLLVLDAADAGRVPLGAELGVAVLTALLVALHTYAFAMVAFVMLVTLLSGKPVLPRLIHLRVLLPAAVALAVMSWVTTGIALPVGAIAVDEPFNATFGTVLDKLGLLFTPTLVTRSGIGVVVAILFWGAAVAGVLATIRNGRSRYAVALRNACVALLAAFVLLPHGVRSFDAVDNRLLPLVLLAACMAIDLKALTPVWRKWASAVAMATGFAVVGVYMVAMVVFQAEAAGFHEVIEQMPRGSRMLYMPEHPDSRIFVSHPFVHYDKLAFVERGILPSQFHFHHASGIFPTKANPILRLPAEHVASNLKTVDWLKYHLNDWDYVMIRTFPESPAPLVPQMLSLMDHRGGWWLYRTTTFNATAGTSYHPRPNG
jgi:hypothetical protein